MSVTPDRKRGERRIIDPSMSLRQLGSLCQLLYMELTPATARGKWQRFKSKDKWAIGRVRAALAASQHPPTNRPPGSMKT